MPATQTATQDETFVCSACAESHEPNEETIKALEESLDPDNLVECDDIQDMFRKCGVKYRG